MDAAISDQNEVIKKEEEKLRSLTDDRYKIYDASFHDFKKKTREQEDNSLNIKITIRAICFVLFVFTCLGFFTKKFAY